MDCCNDVPPLGEKPWGDVIRRVDAGFTVLPGFRLERLYGVPAPQGSWVSITVDDQGRLICADQYGAIYRVVVTGKKVALEKLAILLGGAHGLLSVL